MYHYCFFSSYHNIIRSELLHACHLHPLSPYHVHLHLQGLTPKDLAQQFYKQECVDFLTLVGM